MRVWLVTVGEPLSSDAEGVRLHRAGILANLLAQRGHDVVWWTSTFDHTHKRHRADADVREVLDTGVDIRMLHGCGYRRNVSLRRVLDHILVAKHFVRAVKSEPKPDVILCSLPTLELSVATVRYAKAAGVPAVIDVRDLWPDLFEEVVPIWARRALRPLLFPMRRQARLACQGATAITGNAPDMVAWGLRMANRTAGFFDREFPFGYVNKPLSEEQRNKALTFWTEHGIIPEKDQFTVCYFGVLGRHHEFETVIEAARILENARKPFRFVLCGIGERLEYIKTQVTQLQSVYLPGWVGALEIRTLMEMSQVGLAPFKSNVGYTGNMPNKPIEYLSGGLPIVSTLQGYLRTFLEMYDCGITCANGDAAGLAQTLAALADDSARLKTMSDNARKVFAERFEAEKVYGDMISYLTDVASNFGKEVAER